MSIRKDLELAQVDYEFEGTKAELCFIDSDVGEVLPVTLNITAYDKTKKEFVQSEEKEKETNEICMEYFGVPFNQLTQAVGQKHDVHQYNNFNSLWESTYPVSFELKQVGKLYLDVPIKKVVDDGTGIQIQFEDDEGTLRQSTLRYANYLRSREEWFVDPSKKTKQIELFNEYFGYPVEVALNETEGDSNNKVVGTLIRVQVEKAFGKYAYGKLLDPRL